MLPTVEELKKYKALCGCSACIHLKKGRCGIQTGIEGCYSWTLPTAPFNPYDKYNNSAPIKIEIVEIR